LGLAQVCFLEWFWCIDANDFDASFEKDLELEKKIDENNYE
jgi:hypothetical protein